MYFYKQNNQIIPSVTPLTEGEELIPNTVDASQEKHVPQIEQHGDHVTIKVGSVAHPMLPAHYIQWIILETQTGYQKKDLTPDDKPEADFAVTPMGTAVLSVTSPFPQVCLLSTLPTGSGNFATLLIPSAMPTMRS